MTTPAEARESLAGTIFEGTVEPDAYEALRRDRCVTQAYLVEGRNRVRVYEPEGLAAAGVRRPSTPTLEDAYLVLMRGSMPRRRAGHRRRTAVASGLAGVAR